MRPRRLFALLSAAVLAACATPKVDRVNRVANTRPVERTNDPTTGDLGVEGSRDGVVAKKNERKPSKPTGTGEVETENTPTPPPPPATAKGP